jgi:hypothetical protein
MRKYLLALVIIFIAYNGIAQPSSSNYVSLTVVTTPSYNINTTSEYENTQTLSGAIKLSLKTGKTSCSIYASIPAGITTTSGTSMSVGTVMLAYNSTTCPAPTQNGHTTGNIAMGTSNTFLFGEKKTSTQYSWVYDVIIPAIGYTYAPGTYNYTFQFTMTQP